MLDQMTEILLSNLKPDEHDGVDLKNPRNVYRKSYFDHLDDSSVKSVAALFPEGSGLYERYLEIVESEMFLDDNELYPLVEKYLKFSRQLMDYGIEGEAMDFIDRMDRVEVASSMLQFDLNENPNLLYNYSYGVFGSWLIKVLPLGAHRILFSWAMSKTESTVATAYFVGDYLDVEIDSLKPGFLMWKSGNARSFWAKDNDLTTDTVYCKSISGNQRCKYGCH